MSDIRSGPAEGALVQRYDALVVGAGLAGLYALYRLRAMGLRVVVFEAGADVGGTWYWNRYPGARCDVFSMEYSYSFSEELQQEWTWTERYPAQAEIHRYIGHVADRFGLRRDIRFQTRVLSAGYDEARNLWTLRTDRGDAAEARFVVMAAGCLSASRLPDIEGLGRFKGRWFHSGRWPKEQVGFSGQRVAVLGTGSTGIQIVPEVAAEAGHVHVFQRTANFAIPARNRKLAPDEIAAFKARYAELREKARGSPDGMLGMPPRASGRGDTPEERRAYFQTRWELGGVSPMLTTYGDLLLDREVNESLGEFVREKIRETVQDPEVAEALTPRSHHIGTKRLCQEIGYFEAFNQDHVTLVDIRREPILEITPDGILTKDREYPVDAIIFATGFDAVTGPLLAIDIRGAGGRELREKWSQAPSAYLGLVAAGFPNMFIITGPGSPSVKGNMVVSIEQHVEFISDCIAHMRRSGHVRIDADPEAESEWVGHVREVAEKTLFPTADSWYVGANIPGKPRVFLPYVGGIPAYRKHCERVAANGYEGFLLS